MSDDMSLDHALLILARLHTDDDPAVGFVVHAMANPVFYHGTTDTEYVKAWGVVRKHLKLQTEPEGR